MLEPVIKWSGSKRSQAKEILKYFPSEIDTYYEPFIGGGSVMFALLHSQIKVKHYICSDINKDLIDLYNSIKNQPNEVFNHYKKLWGELNKDNNLDRKKDYFNFIRDRYNEEHNPMDFMFIMRTTTNGMPRYNNEGKFNNSFHITRNGIEPDKLHEIITEWSYTLNSKNVMFNHCSFDVYEPKELDFIYLDPPYANTKGMYFGDFDVDNFFEWLQKINCSWALSFDGTVHSVDNFNDFTYNVPKNIYDEHTYIKSGNSSFRRTIGKSNNSIVYEFLYLKGINKIVNKPTKLF